MRPFALLLPMAISTLTSLNAQQPTGSIDVPSGVQLALEAKGAGVQIYSCTGMTVGAKWVLTALDAKLLDSSGKEIGTHSSGPTWKLTDGSKVQGELVAHQGALDANSIPWLLLRTKPGTATGKLANVAFIRRTQTHGGAPPETGCDNSKTSKIIKIPYIATYSFYTR
jgi:Protein of unknown function (DUF3455)